MTQTDNPTTQSIHPASLGKRMLQGAAIALIPTIFFLSSAGEPNPEWGKYWMIKPMFMIPFAGAMGGVVYYLMDLLRYQGGWKKILANILSVIIYLFGLWMGIVLGLDGTMWD